MAYVEKNGKYYYIRYKDECGKWKRKSCGKNAKRVDADFLANSYSAKELNNHHRAPVRVIKTNLNTSLIKFRDQVLQKSPLGIEKQESSINREKAAVNNVITFVKNRGLLKFNSFDTEMVEQYIDHRLNEGKSAKTRKEELRVLRRFFKWAEKEHLCTENPATNVISPRLQKKIPRFFSIGELTAIFKKAQKPYLIIFKFLFLTGLRVGELCNLEWRDYNWHTKQLTIRIVSADKKKRTPGNKTKREEVIPLNHDAQNILKSLRDSDKKGSHPIFLNKIGNKLDNDNVYKVLKTILKKLEIKGASTHTFRHSFASHLVIKGVSIYTVKELLRHASVKETEVYAHLSKETTKLAVQKLSIDEVKKRRYRNR